MLSDDEVLAAVRRSPEGAGGAFPADRARITRHLLVEGEIVRCVETRTEAARFHKGSRDLSDLPEYDDLARHPVPAPADPAAGSTLRLVRRGSVAPGICVCADGRKHCERCRGAGHVTCPKAVRCTACQEGASCLSCDGSGSRTREPAPRPEDERAARVTCRECGAKESACAKCRGTGTRKCPECGGSEARTCPECKGKGTVVHDVCGGTGRFVRWTEGVVTRVPVTDALRETSSLPSRAFGWTTGRDAWTRVDAEGEKAMSPDGLHAADARRDPDDEAAPKSADDPDAEAAPKSADGADGAPGIDEAAVAAYLKPRLAPHPGEVGRRVRLRHLSVARVAHADRPDRVFLVIPGPSSPRVVSLRSPRRTRQLVGLALLVLAVAVVIAGLLN
ncbi:hypothetical protein [Streptomyces omiyaensis]|uniref:Uncharacterized protein n=1 Tax=Streptomyces omiyaensis TaxID=68247 RepID=A0ABW7BX57_9ACTN